MTDTAPSHALDATGGGAADVASVGAGQRATNVAQQAALAAADGAIANYESNEATQRATGRAGGIADAPGDDRGAPAPTRAERLAELAQMREENFEEFAARGMDVELAQLEGDDDADQDAGVEGGEDSDAEIDASASDEETESTEADDAEVAADGDQDDDTVAYNFPEVDGVNWGDPKSPALRSLMATAFDKDVTQEQFDVFAGWYAETLKGLHANDPAHAKSARAALAEEWGDQHDGRMAAAKATFTRAFPDKTLREQLKQARLPDGRKVANIPEFIRLLADCGNARAPTVDGRLAEVRKILRDDPDRYRRENLGDELLQLLERAESGRSSSAASPAHIDADEQRIAELKRWMRNDRDEYFRNGGSTEYERLLAKREKRSAERAA